MTLLKWHVIIRPTPNAQRPTLSFLSFQGNRTSIKNFVLRQLLNFYGVQDPDEFYINKYLDEAIQRTLLCFSHIRNKYFVQNNINTFHSGQYFIFLYYLSNTVYRNEIKGNENYSDYGTEIRSVCDKIYCLNKVCSSCELYYEVEMPEYFFVDHPLGSVVGRADIENGFVFLQGCTVGGNGGSYPRIGENVFMYSNSKILGRSHIGNNVLIGANTYIKDMDIPDNVMVFGQYPDITIKRNYAERIKQEILRTFC